MSVQTCQECGETYMDWKIHLKIWHNRSDTPSTDRLAELEARTATEEGRRMSDQPTGVALAADAADAEIRRLRDALDKWRNALLDAYTLLPPDRAVLLHDGTKDLIATFGRRPTRKRLLADKPVGAGDTGIVHACPPGDEGLTPCCRRNPLELPRTDRMTLDPALVTCDTEAERHG